MRLQHAFLLEPGQHHVDGPERPGFARDLLQLVADGDPVRLMLLCEKLVAFRDSEGRVGVMDHRCPHRCASLFFGRNEEGGIRCVYHGWKFDTDGNCTDMANVPPHKDFKQKVHAKTYKAAERNGLIWVFMGDQDNVPALPDFEATLLPETEPIPANQGGVQLY